MAVTRRVAKALLLDTEDSFLLLKRTDSHPALAGFYDLPGGTVEAHEEYGEGAVREIQEETGIGLLNTDLKVLYTTTHLIAGKSYPTILFYHKLSVQKPDIVLSWEHQSYEWAHLDRLSEVEPQLASTYREALEYIRLHSVIEDIDIS